METLKQLPTRFWNEDFWLPANVTWDDIKSSEEVNYPDFSHLLIPLGLSLLVLAAEFAVETCIWSPIGRLMGIKSRRNKRAPFNEVLEEAYKNGRCVSYKHVVELAKQLDMTERRVHRWLRVRKLQDYPDKLTRFREISGPFTYYVCSFTSALFILRSKPWFWEISLCYDGAPFHQIDNDIWCYYMASMAYTWAMMIRQFMDHRRKDFWPMMIHHILTISLLMFSWVSNLVRIGSLTLFVHDVADIFLLGAKMLRYLGLPRACSVVFTIFTAIWIFTRLFVFPGWIVYGLYVLGEPPTAGLMPAGLPILSRPEQPYPGPRQHVTPFPAQTLFLMMLMCLQVLHCMWTYYLFVALFNTLRTGEVEGDMRSDSSEVSSDTQAANCKGENKSAEPKKPVLANMGTPGGGSSAATAGGDSGGSLTS